LRSLAHNRLPFNPTPLRAYHPRLAQALRRAQFVEARDRLLIDAAESSGSASDPRRAQSSICTNLVFGSDSGTIGHALRHAVLLVPRPRQFDRAAAAHLPALLVDPLRDGEVRCGGAVVVGVERDLIISGAAREGSVEDLSQLMDLVPGNDAFFDWIENPGLAFVIVMSD
jgi:hypothetical protein